MVKLAFLLFKGGQTRYAELIIFANLDFEAIRMLVSSVFLLCIFEKEIRISNSNHLGLHFKEYLLNIPK